MPFDINCLDEEFEEKIIKFNDGSRPDAWTWTIIKAFFEENGLIRHQLESYNDFVCNRIQKIVSANSFEIGEGKYKVSFGEVYIDSPSFKEIDDQVRQVMPYECLHRLINYASNMYVDVTIESSYKNDKDRRVEYHAKVYIGNILTMTKSDLCHLAQTGIAGNDVELTKRKECIYDEGGYFISKGQKKILVCQEKSCPNRVYIFDNRKDSPKYSLYAEVRSCNHEGTHTTKVHVGFYTLPKKKYAIQQELISVVVPYIPDANAVPLMIMFYALGVKTEKEVVQLILPPENRTHDYIKLLLPSFEAVKGEEYTREKALEYIGKRGKKFMSEEDEEDIPDMKAKDIAKGIANTRDQAISYAKNLIRSEFLPHMGRRKKPKLYFFAYMVQCLIYSKLASSIPSIGIKREDRDHYDSKRILGPADLLGAQFNTAFRRFCNETKKNAEKHLSRNKGQLDILSFMKPAVITNNMHMCITNNAWSTPSKKGGISQPYEQFNYICSLSSLSKEYTQDTINQTFQNFVHEMQAIQ